MAQSLKITIIGDAASYSRALKSASSATTTFGSTLAKVGKVAALATGAAGIGGLFLTLRAGTREWVETTKQAAQTAAVLKSTGGVANVTAKQVDELASSLLKKTGIDDEQIRAGENWLLTFKNIRNEVGKNNDIFNQAIKASVDLAVAQATVKGTTTDTTTAANLLGKALNDPIKGISALTRVGVGFTEGQKKSIKALVQHGRTLEAQKIILKEVNSQIGGSAEAFGKTLPGQIKILQEQFNNLAGELVGHLVPAFTVAFKALTGFIQKFSAAKGFKAKIGVTLEVARNAFDAVRKQVSDLLFGSFQKGGGVGPEGIKFNQGLVAKFTAALAALDWTQVGQAVVGAIGDAMQATGDLAKRIGATFAEAIRNVDWVATGRVLGPGLAAAVAQAFVTLTDPVFWAKNWDLALAVAVVAFPVGRLAGPLARLLAKPFADAVIATAAVLERLSPRLAEAFIVGMAKLPALIGGVTARLLGLFNDLLGRVGAVFGRLGRVAVFTIKVLGVQAAINAAVQVGEDIVNAVGRGTANLVGKVRDAFQRLWEWIKGAAGSAYAFAFRIGSQIVQGVIDGFGDIARKIGSTLKSGVERGLHAIDPRNLKPWSPVSHWATLLAQELVKDIGAIQAILGPSLARQITASLKSAGNAGLAAGEGLAKSVVKGMGNASGAIVAAAKKAGVDARAALAVAMTEGGTKFGAVGDSGTSFGPFQLHIGGASPFSDPRKAAQFANSIEGITYALQKMAAAGAAGKSGFDAIKAIVYSFERPANPAAEVAKALTYYKQIPAQLGEGLAAAGAQTSAATVQTLTQIANLVKSAGKVIGLDNARQIAAGLFEGSPGIVAQVKAALQQAMAAAKQAVIDAKAGFVSAFQGLANEALAAFDAVAAKWKPPSLRILEKMQLEDQINSAVKAVADAQARIDAAVAAQSALTRAEGESDADFAARQAQAQADVKAAVEELGAAQRSYTETQLQLRAAQEQKAHDEKMARDREHFAAELLQLQTWLAKHPEEWDKAQAKIVALLKKYDVPMFEAGKRFASQFADGLRQGIAAVAKAARELAEALDKYVPHSPAKEGPLAYDVRKVGLAWAQNWAAGVAAGGFPLGTSPSVATVAARGGGGGAVVNVYVQGALLGSTVPEVARTIHSELLRINGRNTTLGFT